MANLKRVGVRLGLLGIAEVSGEWAVDEAQRRAAWEMYVELVTRIAVAELQPEEGLLREALSSLHSLFGTTRQILRKYGPDIALPKDDSDISFGYLAVAVLNTTLRPFLAKWDPILLDYESRRPEGVSPLEHERQWERNQELREALASVRSVLVDYATVLAEVAGVPSLVA
jgi:hypothetical protein